MPTAAKLLSALILAAVGWMCGELVKPLMPEGRDLSYLSPTTAAVGFFVGWFYLGPRADRGLGTTGANAGTTLFVQVFMTLFTFAFAKMIGNSLRKRYDGPIEALQDIFIIGFEMAIEYTTAEIAAVAILGVFIASSSAFYAARKWG
ncbi:TrgA family protein [Aliiroseovarius sp. S1123]|uniref:TrgA family protein n=1 Tax=unclassified Aliiroseovarius TaxID=2623558 RepID=UPI001FF4381F|nr:TrgA family protein [Aliiroseovarius sp. S1123]MCK0170102.1 TrgA family protein [Aliiroseovarius sp. S1123]